MTRTIIPAHLINLLERLTPETLALMYRDVTEVDDILTESLAYAVFAQLTSLVGEDRSVKMLDLVGVSARPMTTVQDLRRWLEMDNASTEQATDAAIAVYKQAKAEAKTAAAPWDALATEAKSILTDIIAETGVTSFETASGMAYIPAPGKVITYDTDALDALCKSDDNLRRILWPHREVKERPGHLTVR